MTILLYKDGKLIVDTEQPLEGVSLDNLAAILSGASDGDVIQYDATNGMWVNKIAPSSLPEVTASDKGKYLKANESTGDPEWASGSSGGGVLVVHESDAELPVLDKTWTEIKDACDSGSIVITVTADNDITYLASVPAQYGEDTFVVSFMISGTTDTNTYIASSANGYPTAN